MSGSLLLDTQALLVTLALTAPRMIAMLYVLPGIPFRMMSGLLGSAAALGLVMPAALPTFEYVQNTPPDYFMSVILILKETAFGGLLGTLLAIPAWVIQSVGSILDAQRAPIQLQSNNAALDQDASAVGGMLVQALMVVMIHAGLFVAITRIMIESYAVWPAYSLLPPFEPGHFDVVLKRFGEFFWYVAVYGGPVLIPLVMVDFGFAMIGVFASNLQVSFASSPIKCLVGLFIMLIYWPTLSHYVGNDFAHVLDVVATLIQAAPAHK